MRIVAPSMHSRFIHLLHHVKENLLQNDINNIIHAKCNRHSIIKSQISTKYLHCLRKTLRTINYIVNNINTYF